jgi:hypothetical protein
VALINLLYQSFINNLTVSGQKLLNAQEIEALISGTGVAYTFSGATTKFQVDLAAQRSVNKFSYSFSPITLSGLTIQYGRDLNSLTTATPSITSSGVEVLPTVSGFSYPRYFTVTHVAASGSGTRTVSGLFIENTQTEINYGSDGLQDSVTITASGNSGYSPITELKVMNSGTIPTDIYVSVDTYNTSLEILENLEIAPTATGVFSSFNEDYVMPSGIPWEWGNFNSISVIEDQLRLDDPGFTFPTFNPGSIYTLLGLGNMYGNRAFTAKKLDGTHLFVAPGASNQPLLVDPVRNTVIIGATPGTTPANDSQRSRMYFAWDLGDRLYYMLSRTSNDQNIYYYRISTNTHHTLTTASGWFVRYHHALVFNNGNLYVYGGKATAPTSDTDGGNQFWRINVTTLVQTQLTSPPFGFSTDSVDLESAGTEFIYLYKSPNSNVFSRYVIANNVWENVTLVGPETFIANMSYKSDTNEIWVLGDGDYYVHNIVTGFTEQTPRLTSFPNNSNSLGFAIGVDNSMLYGMNGTSFFNDYKIYILNTVPDPVISFSVSGTYTSPVFRLENTTDYHRILVDYLKNSASLIKFDNGIGVDNFQIRGADESPSAYNTVQNFDSELDPDEFVIRALTSESVIGTLDGTLVFNHRFVSSTETPYQSGYITYGFPFITTGDMQYRFWWDPPSNKVAANANLSRFYIVPFQNTLVTGDEPERDSATLRRTTDNNIYIQLGQTSDSGGTFTQLRFYKGDATVNYSISARSGTSYQIELLINWDSGVYKLYFNGTLLGTGSIPLARINLLKDTHTYEIHSLGQNISFDEKFKYLSVSRVSNTIDELGDVLAVPIHRNDPKFGDSGSLTWFPVTVNSALTPKYKYVQFRLTLRGNDTYNFPVVSQVRFPKVIKLENVSPGQTKSVFVRYKFPSVNGLSTNTVYLRSWMYTDKI